MRRSTRRFPSTHPHVRLRLAVVAPLLAAACTRGEPPAWDGGSLSAVPLAPLSKDAGSPFPPTAPSLDASSDVAPIDPGTLPQTRDRPKGGAAFQARATRLWEAIVADDADIAVPFFFPVAAYRQVKAIPNPEGDWKRRLLAAFRRDVHKLHDKLGKHAQDAKLVELEVATERAHWVNPGEESNKIGYWRVFGSKLRYETDRGAAAMDVVSLISWRGEWYVVHLGSFH